jgi:hypothetical protein
MKTPRKISSIRNFMSTHPRLVTLGFSLAVIAVASLILGFADHQAYAKIEDQNTLVIPSCC